MISFDVFSPASFPVVICDGNGIVIYKNPICKTTFYSLRRGASMERRVVSGTILGDDTRIVKISGQVTFDKALVSSIVMENERYRAMFFLPILQLEQFPNICDEIASAYAEDIIGFFIDSANMMRGYSCRRICGDMIDFVKKQYEYLNMLPAECDTYQALELLFPKLTGAFRMLGVRISAELDKDVLDGRICTVRAHTFVFIVCRMVYCAIRASSSKIVQISAHHDDRTNQIVITVKTDSDVKPRHETDIVSLAPECALEERFVEEAIKMHDAIKIRSLDGKIALEYHADCAYVP